MAARLQEEHAQLHAAHAKHRAPSWEDEELHRQHAEAATALQEQISQIEAQVLHTPTSPPHPPAYAAEGGARCGRPCRERPAGLAPHATWAAF